MDSVCSNSWMVAFSRSDLQQRTITMAMYVICSADLAVVPCQASGIHTAGWPYSPMQGPPCQHATLAI